VVVLPPRLPSATAILFVLHLLENEVYEAAHGSVLSGNNCVLLYRTFALAIGSSMASRA